MIFRCVPWGVKFTVNRTISQDMEKELADVESEEASAVSQFEALVRSVGISKMVFRDVASKVDAVLPLSSDSA